MASAGARVYMGSGAEPQWGPGAKPVVRGSEAFFTIADVISALKFSCKLQYLSQNSLFTICSNILNDITLAVSNENDFASTNFKELHNVSQQRHVIMIKTITL